MFEKGGKYFFDFEGRSFNASVEEFDKEAGLLRIKAEGSGDEYIISVRSGFKFAKIHNDPAGNTAKPRPSRPRFARTDDSPMSI